MTTTLRNLLFLTCFCSLFIWSTDCSAQKSKTPQKLDKRKYDIEIKETTTEGKKYEKDVFEFTPKEIVSDYFDTKFKVATMHYKTLKDSTYTDDGEEMKYYKVSASEKTDKPGEEFHIDAVINGRDISGKIVLKKGETVKKSWEFEGTQNN